MTVPVDRAAPVTPAVTPAGVAAALARLEELQDVPVQTQVQVYDAVHRSLQDALATLDEV